MKNIMGCEIVGESVQSIISSMLPVEESVKDLATYLGYSIGNDPINDNSDWSIFFTDKIDNHSSGVMAIRTVEELNQSTSIIDIRRLYKEVELLKESFAMSFSVQVVGFIGKERIIFFPYLNGNRDIRLDLNIKTMEIPLYQNNFNLLKNESVLIVEDEFGFVDSKIVLNIQDIFKRELSSHFRLTTNFYRKKLSELITGSRLRRILSPLLDSGTKKYLEQDDLINLVSERSYTRALSTVVDTIILLIFLPSIH
ncbi:hypothetical protein ACTQ5R_06185 [Ruoffia tabacinasalis]|uniref:hypothetical protein n=1 Tax=Ruoffia tabacinasalis TaxID=87458 RepID=UPI003F972457